VPESARAAAADPLAARITEAAVALHQTWRGLPAPASITCVRVRFFQDAGARGVEDGPRESGIGLPAAVPEADMTLLGRWAADEEGAGDLGRVSSLAEVLRT
jgi:hypothetical protein